MDGDRFDDWTRQLTAIASRRSMLRALAGGALAALALAPDEAAAACRMPKRRCDKGGQCCTKRCRRGKCVPCPNGATLLLTPDRLCWLAWGSYGSGDGQFNQPNGVAMGGNGHVYVGDNGNHRVQEFDATGTFVRKWGKNGGDGTDGTGDGQFTNATGVAVGGNGHLYVADPGNNRVQEFDVTLDVGDSGFFVRKWGTVGSGNGQFNNPVGLAVGGNGHVYVSDPGNNRVQEFTATGVFVRVWGSGSGDGRLIRPYGVAVRGNGHVYVSDPGIDVPPNNRVLEFDAKGVFVRAWGSRGSGDGQFYDPLGVAVGANGHVYVADANNQRIVRVLPL